MTRAIALAAAICLAAATAPAEQKKARSPDDIKKDIARLKARLAALEAELARAEGAKVEGPGPSAPARETAPPPRLVKPGLVKPALVELHPTHTLAPPKGQTAFLAVSKVKLDAYTQAVFGRRQSAADKLVEDGEVVLVKEPLSVAIESTREGLAYFRPTEGPHKGKLLVADGKLLVKR